MSDIEFGYLLKALILPPCGNFLCALMGYALRRRWPAAGAWMIGLALGSLFLLSVPMVGLLLAHPLESTRPFNVTQGTNGAEAIVILGGGVYPSAPEFGGRNFVHPRTLERLHYGVFLHRVLNLPVAVVGGSLIQGVEPEGILMFGVLRRAFHIPVRWIEVNSRNTAENATFSRQLIPVKRILLVTQALHMARARMMFEASGFQVIPAPLGYRTNFDPNEISVFDFVPAINALHLSHDALHEYMGILWYRWHYPVPAAG